MKLLQHENVKISDVTHLIKLDPALTGRILQFANSAAVGSQRAISSISDAIVILGLNTVKNFALSLSLIGSKNDDHCTNFDYAGYWSRSLATAVALAALNALNRVVSTEEAFTFGLLNEIGRLALATAWSKSYNDCLLTAIDEDDLLKIEQDRFAITHLALTPMLLADWGFSGIFIDALKAGQDFETSNVDVLSKASQLQKQLTFCNQLAAYCLANEKYRVALMPALMIEAVKHKLESNISLNNFIHDVLSQWQEWGNVIGIKTTPSQSVTLPFSVDTTSSGLNILIVDDNKMMLARLLKQLAPIGHQIDLVDNGHLALKRALEHKPDLMIIRQTMQVMTGIELTKTLHSSSWGKSIYILMLMSTEDENILIEAFNAGIDDYISIPVSLKVLLARIRAGQRIINLQHEIQKERRDLQRYIAELALSNRRLELMANTDALTGLSNRRYSLNRLDQEWATAQRNRTPLSVLLLDLDHFKSVNDSLGHDAGDLVLVHAANILRACTRTTDITCRLGGEEFLVIAPNTNGKDAVFLAERIRQSIEQNQPKSIVLQKPMTTSIGVACTVNGNFTAKELISIADEALYAVKRHKRNGVKLGTP